MPTKHPLKPLPKPIGTLTDIGHSHMSDAGATKPYYGAVHKIDGLLQPATYRSTSQGGAIHSRADQGNTAGGDGGWGRQLGEFARLENSYGDSGTLWGATTMTGGPYAVGATSFTANSIQGLYPNEYIVVGAGANTEIVRIYGSPAGSTVSIQAPFTKAHAAGDPVYHSMTNFGAGASGQGYNAKDEIVLIGAGSNDVAPLGPFAQGTFGTNAGASRGLTPFQNALRFTIAQMRCAVIYLPNHPSNIPGAGSAVAAQSGSQSYPVQGYFSPTPGQNGQLGYTQTANSTWDVATAPDFPGGTVDFFFKSGQDGGGALWNLTIDGSSVVPFAGTGILDTRSKQFVQYNSSLAQSTAGGVTSSDTGIVYRITGLSAGVHAFHWTANVLTVGPAFNGLYLGWGVEAPVPPMIFCFLDPRLPSYTAYSSSPYATRAPVNSQGVSTQTATVSAGAGTANGSVTLGTAITIGTTATGGNAVYPGDSITIGTGATQETRRVVLADSTTTLHVDVNFVNAHTGEACVIGYQDADLVGGGYRNQSDTQGKTSVPGVHSTIRSVAAEFDRFVQVFSVDTVFTGGPGNDGPTVNSPYFAADYSHYSDYGQGLLAAQFYQALLKSAWANAEISLATVPSQRTYNPVAGDIYPASQPSASGAWPSFVNGWTNFWPINTAYPRTGFYMDMRTREVYIRGAITNALVYPDQLPSAVFQLPPGYRPAYQTMIKAWGPLGPVMMEIDNQGYVYVSAGYWNLTNAIGGSTSAVVFEDVFLSET